MGKDENQSPDSKREQDDICLAGGSVEGGGIKWKGQRPDGHGQRVVIAGEEEYRGVKW